MISLTFLACSQTFYFLFKVRRARVIKNKNPGGFVDRQHKGLGMGEEENRRFFLALRARSRALADVSEKNEKKLERRRVQVITFHIPLYIQKLTGGLKSDTHV